MLNTVSAYTGPTLAFSSSSIFFYYYILILQSFSIGSGGVSGPVVAGHCLPRGSVYGTYAAQEGDGKYSILMSQYPRGEKKM